MARVVLPPLALALVPTAAVTRTTGIAANLAIVLVLTVLMVRARRTQPALRATRTWMLAALLSGVVAAIAALVDSALSPGASYPRPGDLIELLYVPCCLAALMVVPLKGQRLGYRARAFGDGLVAVTSLLFLTEPLLDGLLHAHRGLLPSFVAFAIPVGGVFVVATALTALTRCTDEARPMLGWLSAGLAMTSAADLVFAVDPVAAQGARRALLQLGLTTLVGAAVARPGSTRPVVEEVSRVLGVLPFVPFVAAVGLAGTYVWHGQGLAQDQLVLAIAIGIALVVRQWVGSRDKTRLVLELERREARLVQELRVDPLTGVANRLGLEEALEHALQVQEQFGLVVVDLDDFKLVNDNHGHTVGDEVLRHVSTRLLGSVRGGDVVARLGGDEFAVLVHGAPTVLATVGDRLVQALAVPVVAGGRSFRLTASIGLVSKQEGDSVAQLLADADGAMYEAKGERGTSTVVHLDPAGRRSVAWRSQVREEVAHPALEQFAVHYQPVVDLRSGELVGVEALLRWHHPQHGTIAPDLFIPLAEQSGSIGVLGDFVLTSAVRDLALLSRSDAGRGLSVGINVSPRQLGTPSFAARVADVLEEHRVAPARLVVEITEQAFETDVDSMAASVRQLVAGGVAVAVDDFGTGYSSLRYLQALPLALLKVDRTFTSGIGRDGRQERLLDGIAALAHRMDLRIVAEGIETAEQLALLQAFGCQHGQGYLFSRPLPLAELHPLVTSGHTYDVRRPLASLPAPRVPEEVLRTGSA